MTSTAIPLAYSYIRFSTPEQQYGDSAKRQSDLSHAYARHKGLVLNESLTYRDLGVSAFDQSNVRDGKLGDFLKAVRSGLVPAGSYFLVESLDRISRAQITEAFEIFMGIINSGIIIVTLADGMEYSKEKANNQFTDLVVSIAIMSRAHEESLMKSRRLKAVWNSKRENIAIKKLTKTAPAWLTLSDDRTEYILIDEKADLVKSIFEWTRDGIGTGTITKRLNGNNVPTFTKKASMWHDSYIQKIVENRAVIGEFQPHKVVDAKRVPVGEPVKDYFPRIISDELFATAHASRKSRLTHSRGRKGTGVSNLFSGILKCGYCKASLVYMNKGYSGKRAKLLACTKAKAGKGCFYIPWEYDAFEQSVLTYCQGLDLKGFLQERNNIESERVTLEGKIELLKSDIVSIKQKELNILGAIEDGAKYTQFASRADELSQERSKAEISLLTLQSHYDQVLRKNVDADLVRSSIKELISVMNEKTGDELHDLRSALSSQIKKILQQISIYPGGYMDSQKYINGLRAYLLECGHTSEEVEKQISKEIAKTVNVSERFFTMASYAGAIKIIKPSSENPVILDYGLSTSNADENVNALFNSLSVFADTMKNHIPKGKLKKQ